MKTEECIRNVPPWTEIEVIPEHPGFNGEGRILDVWCWWCGGPALYLVNRTSTLTGYTYSDWACERCAGPWKTAEEAAKTTGGVIPG